MIGSEVCGPSFVVSQWLRKPGLEAHQSATSVTRPRRRGDGCRPTKPPNDVMTRLLIYERSDEAVSVPVSGEGGGSAAARVSSLAPSRSISRSSEHPRALLSDLRALVNPAALSPQYCVRVCACVCVYVCAPAYTELKEWRKFYRLDVSSCMCLITP